MNGKYVGIWEENEGGRCRIKGSEGRARREGGNRGRREEGNK